MSLATLNGTDPQQTIIRLREELHDVRNQLGAEGDNLRLRSELAKIRDLAQAVLTQK